MTLFQPDPFNGVVPTPLEATVSNFLKIHWKGEPLLLALSGGPDSRALFEVLSLLDIPFHVAHVDHGWREESAKEAEMLAALCAGRPFHLKKLTDSQGPNLEDRARKERLRFFKQIIDNQGLESVLLAHHADDQAETVLKRLFEGASIYRLKGLAQVTSIDGLPIWRPFLSRSKKEIYSFLEQRGITPFSDATNEDGRFLRPRMRTELLPLLSQVFGKQVQSSLCRIGESAFELSAFLEELLAPYRERVEKCGHCVSLDLSETTPKTPFEWKAVVRDFFDREDLSLPSSVCEALVTHLQKHNSNKTMIVGKSKVLIHRGVITLEKTPIDRETPNGV